MFKLQGLCLRSFAIVGSLVAVGGCAGVYAEVVASQLSSASVAPSGGGDSVDVDGASTLGFNLGVDFGSTRQRFAVGYASETARVMDTSSSVGASAMRYDFNVLNLADRLKLRIGLGAELGDGTASGFAGLDLTYFVTWRNAIHVLVGGRGVGRSVPGGRMIGTGITARISISHTFGDARPDQTLMESLDDNRDITGIIERGAAAIGCRTKAHSTESTYAYLDVSCPGDRTIWFFQMAQGIMVTCRHEQSKARCRDLTKSIVVAATRPPEPKPKPTPALAAPVAAPAEAPPAP